MYYKLAIYLYISAPFQFSMGVQNQNGGKKMKKKYFKEIERKFKDALRCYDDLNVEILETSTKNIIDISLIDGKLENHLTLSCFLKTLELEYPEFRFLSISKAKRGFKLGFFNDIKDGVMNNEFSI